MSSLLPHLKDARRKAGLSQAKLAEIIDRTVKTYRSWEKTETPPDCRDLVQLAEALDVSTDYLLGRIEERHLDVHYACDITGLSETAVENIIKLRRERERFNSVLESDLFSSLIELICGVCDSVEDLAYSAAVVNTAILHNTINLPTEIRSSDDAMNFPDEMTDYYRKALQHGPEELKGQRWEAMSAVNNLINSLCSINIVLKGSEKVRAEVQKKEIADRLEYLRSEDDPAALDLENWIVENGFEYKGEDNDGNNNEENE